MMRHPTPTQVGRFVNIQDNIKKTFNLNLMNKNVNLDKNNATNSDTCTIKRFTAEIVAVS